MLKSNIRKLRYYLVDVFGSEKYSGNQLAVFTDTDNLSTEEMQKIAYEINFSETTFVTGFNLDLKIFDVRIFTPFNEVPFAGHPTLGTAYVANDQFLDGNTKEVILNLQIGRIPVIEQNEVLWMKQAQPRFDQQFDLDSIAKILGIGTKDIDKDNPIEIVSTGLPFIVVPLCSLSALKKARVNNSLLKNLPRNSIAKEIIVFTKETYDSTHQLAARVFAPEFGIVEDAATGSANGCLSAYLLKNNYFGTGPIELSVAQGFEINRPSMIYHKSGLKGEKYDINIGGKVVPIAEGIWY